jgi:hypothetical protein
MTQIFIEISGEWAICKGRDEMCHSELALK